MIRWNRKKQRHVIDTYPSRKIRNIKSPGKSLEILYRIICTFHASIRTRRSRNRLYADFVILFAILIPATLMQTWIRIARRVSISALLLLVIPFHEPPLLLHAILFLPFEIESLKLMGGRELVEFETRDIIGAYVEISRFIFSFPSVSTRLVDFPLLTSWFLMSTIQRTAQSGIASFSGLKYPLFRCVEKIKSIVDPFRKIFIEFRSSSIYLSFDWMENIDRHISRRRLITGV